MLMFPNQAKDFFVQETSLLPATQGGPTIKERKFHATILPKPEIFITINHPK